MKIAALHYVFVDVSADGHFAQMTYYIYHRKMAALQYVCADVYSDHPAP
jgi:hypothetical protein